LQNDIKLKFIVICQIQYKMYLAMQMAA